MIHDTLSNWSRYFSAPPWRVVFDYLRSLDATAEDCPRVALQGDDIYAAVMTYATGGPEAAKLEAHDQYIDIQMALINSEGIDWFPRAVLEVTVPYDAGRDRTLYVRPAGMATRVNNHPGLFTVLYPDDAHMPKLMVGGAPEQVKKVVVKLHRALID